MKSDGNIDFKKYFKYIGLFFLSIFSVYILSDKIFLPYFLYVKETTVPNVVGHNISTAKKILDQSNLKYEVQYITSNKNDIIGNIIYHHPVSNKIVKKETIIDLTVSGSRESYIVPNLIAQDKNRANHINRLV